MVDQHDVYGVGWARIADSHPDSWTHPHIQLLAPASPAIGLWVADHPEWLDAALDPGVAQDPEVMAAAFLDQAPDPAAPLADMAMATHLAALHRQTLIRIAVRDLTGQAAMEAVGRQLSDLAQAMIMATLDWLGNDAGLAVIGMGKLGGQELNYISDVDVVFIHDGEGPRADRLARRLLAILGGHTPLGPVYTMDANLRPEGRNGPLSRTLVSWQAYWDRWAKTWEAQAFLKARPVGGHMALGDALIKAGASMVWPAQLGENRVNEIRAMKQQVEESAPVRRDGDAQLKLAPGGLRDIEFTVQLLQLIHGHIHPSLQVAGTLPALQALAREGLVSTADATKATYAYQAMRTVEHRLQLYAGRRTHTVPTDPATRTAIALACGFRDDMQGQALTYFDQHLAHVRREARLIYQSLFLAPLLDVVANYSKEDALTAAGKMPVPLAMDRLAVLGFDAPKRAAKNLHALMRLRGRLNRPVRMVLPALINELAQTGDPDGGLGALRTLIEQSGHHPLVQQIIAENPPAASLLVRALGNSPRIGPVLARQPERLALFEHPAALTQVTTRKGFSTQADHFRARGLQHGVDQGLRRILDRERLRIMIRSIIDGAEVVQTGAELSALADTLMQLSIEAVCPPDVRLAVIALGRWGAQALAFGSDLDAMIVYQGDREAATHAVEQLLRLNEAMVGQIGAFTLDLELRPGGRSGAITLTPEGARSWLAEWAEPWQLQAFTLARYAAGDADLANQAISAWAPLVYPEEVGEDRIRAIRQMKARVEAERGQVGLQIDRRLAPRTQPRPPWRPGARLGTGTRGRVGIGRPASPNGRLGAQASGPGQSLKHAPGGLSDVEWITQLYAIRHGATQVALQQPSTLARLEVMGQSGALDDQAEQFLRDGWIWLSRVRNGLWLLGVADHGRLPTDPKTLGRLAALLAEPGITHAQGVSEQTERARRRIRKVFDQAFWM